jgi:hypothetical protein
MPNLCIALDGTFALKLVMALGALALAWLLWPGGGKHD